MAYLERTPLKRFGEEVTAIRMTESDLEVRKVRISPDDIRNVLSVGHEDMFEVRAVYVYGREYAVIHAMSDTFLPSLGCATGCVYTETWCARGPVLVMGHDKFGPGGLTQMDIATIRGTAEVWTWRRDDDMVPVDIRVYLKAHDTLDASLNDAGPMCLVES